MLHTKSVTQSVSQSVIQSASLPFIFEHNSHSSKQLFLKQQGNHSARHPASHSFSSLIQQSSHSTSLFLTYQSSHSAKQLFLNQQVSHSVSLSFIIKQNIHSASHTTKASLSSFIQSNSYLPDVLVILYSLIQSTPQFLSTEEHF